MGRAAAYALAAELRSVTDPAGQATGGVVPTVEPDAAPASAGAAAPILSGEPVDGTASPAGTAAGGVPPARIVADAALPEAAGVEAAGAETPGAGAPTTVSPGADAAAADAVAAVSGLPPAGAATAGATDAVLVPVVGTAGAATAGATDAVLVPVVGTGAAAPDAVDHPDQDTVVIPAVAAGFLSRRSPPAPAAPAPLRATTPAGPAPAHPDGPPPADRRTRRASLQSAAAFLLVAVATIAAHVGAAWLAAARVATTGETQLAVAALAARSQSGNAGPLTLTDRFAAVQIAVVELLLPAGDPVDTARWACLVLGVVTTLLVWPVVRRLEMPLPAAFVAVALLGVALPVLVLRGGVSAAAPAALWLTLAAVLATRERGRVALLFAILAAATAPLTAAALLGFAAYLVLLRVAPVRGSTVVGAVLGVAAGVIAALSAGPGPLADRGGPDLPTSPAVVGAVVALLLVVLSATLAPWLRPALAGAVPLLVVLLVPGPSRIAAALLVLPVLAVGVAVLVEQVRAGGRRLLFPVLAAVLALIVVPVPVALARSRGVLPMESLATWVVTATSPGTVVVADPLDRAALLAAGFPAAQLRAPQDPAVEGELRLVSARPDDGNTPCPDALVLAATPRGAGGAPGAVCTTSASSPPADGAPARARFGSALAVNPGLTFGPAALDALRAGHVDPRLMLTLAALTGAHHIAIGDLPAVALDAATVPRRQAVITMIDGLPAGSSTLLHGWLDAQQAPFAPLIDRADGPSLLIVYPVPAPPNLLPS